jgi:histidinol-phosphatase (PHP family)
MFKNKKFTLDFKMEVQVMFDCHVHSFFSGDSEVPAEIACNKAIQLGLEGIAFTDHLDIDYPNFDANFNINFDEYSIYMDNLKNKYLNKLKILNGIEVGFQPHVIVETKKIIDSYDFDFVLGSVHVIDGMDPYYEDYFKGKTKEQAFLRYLEEIYISLSDFPYFDVLGHIGYLRRYGNLDDRSLRYVDYQDILELILKKAVFLGIGLEVNSSGLRTNLGTPIPDYDIIKRYKELGGEIICVGSDAHFEEHIGDGFNEITEKLKEIGFKYTTHFEKRKPIFDKI